ncbi:PepSY domain-containing protein [Jiella avicenniae]|uniref:PepSY domain-containing protein n=1 Tax=Jiella avicenniae TaxID=2907202 RepID=A0A9X1P4H7_9HYPH|nr:PepSY domain-containing protein [Jiella avicenniae]MCE7029118.1 PepSY domain-containing protein [Jiella avicenniae]
MRRSYWAHGVIVASALAMATPALSQQIQIGRDGVRIVPQEDMRRRGDRDDYYRRDHRRDVREGVSEREAIRIARRQGMRDVGAVTKTRQTYRVAGTDRRGHRIRVDIDRDSGAVIRVR